LLEKESNGKGEKKKRTLFAPKRQNTVLGRKQIVEILRKIIIRHGSEHLTIQKLAATTFFGMLQGLVTIWPLSEFSPMLEIKNESMWEFFFETIKQDGKALER